jgi:hypothetical protein
MIPESVWHATAASTAVAFISDLIVYAIQQGQRERGGLPQESMGILWRSLLSLIFNFAAIFLFAYTYHAVALGSGRVYLAGGLLWLAVVIPVLMTSHHVDDWKKAILTTRIFGWLFKTAATCVAIDYFIG